MSSSVAFDDVARSLVARGSAVHPAEAHGCLCGALCARGDYSRAEWLEEILADGDDAGTDDPVLGQLYEQGAAALAATDLGFQPLLPGDEAGLAARVDALAAWCQGFLYGFGSAGTAGRRPLPGDVSEALADLARISQAGAPGADSPEEEEEAYAELVEFLRAAVQLVYEELDGLRASQPSSPSTH